MLIFALGNTPTPRTNHAPTCNYKTPSVKAYRSPGHLIQLPQREPGVTELAAVMRKMYDAMKADKSAIIAGKKRPEYPSFNRSAFLAHRHGDAKSYIRCYGKLNFCGPQKT